MNDFLKYEYNEHWGGEMRRNIKTILRACVAVIALGNAMPASAALIEYTLSGIGGASLNGTAYSGDFVATAIGDTSIDYNPDPLITTYLSNPLLIKFGGIVITSTLPTLLFASQITSNVGFIQLNSPTGGTGFHYVTSSNNASFGTYVPDTNIGPVSVTFDLFPQAIPQYLDTDLGRLTWTPGSFRNVTFKAQLVTTSVPEPASWALMITGFGMAGIALRRRQKVRIAYA